MHMNRLIVLLISVVALNGADPTSSNWYQAIRNNDLSSIKRMASSRPALEIRDARGTTPLMYAAAVGSVEALNVLLKAGAEVNAKNGLNVTPLHFAGAEMAKVRMLVDAGADVDAKSKGERTALIVAAGRPGSHETVRLLLSKGANTTVADRGSFTALIEAARANNTEALSLLLSKPHAINAANVRGFTALMQATGHANLAAVKLLLKNGADVNAAVSSNMTVRAGKIAISEMTALMTAPLSSPEVIDVLLKAGAKVNARDVRGMTPLMFAVASDVPNVATIRMLIEAGADKDIKSNESELARDWAAKYNHAEVASLVGAPVRTVKPTLAKDNKPGGLRESITQALGLLQSSSTEYFKQSGCVGCHHQPLIGLAVERASRKGFILDAAARTEQLRVVRTEFSSTKENLFLGVFISVDSLNFTMLHLTEAEYPADDLTDALVSAIAAQQQPDGAWLSGLGIMRPPLEDSEWVRTAMAVRALARYTIPARRAEFEARIAKARRWLSESQPHVSYERTFQLLGLVWASAPTLEITRTAAEVKRMQQTDGGWSQTDSLPTDAFATGVALYALAQSGMSSTDPIYLRGVEYLLTTQKADGSWYVPSRAPKLQPYFQSGFPYTHDQWISAAATSFATVALIEAVR
jgi:ankyrin repeat protein